MSADELRVRSKCCTCQSILDLGGGWWHQHFPLQDMCETHYKALSKGQRKRFVEVLRTEALGSAVERYLEPFTQWWEGRALHVAVLTGGNWLRLPCGSKIQACDESCTEATKSILRAAGFKVWPLDINCLGSAGEAGDRARADLLRCKCIVVPGGHDLPQATSLGDLGRETCEEAASAGTGFVGVCAGAWLLGLGDGGSHNFGWMPVRCHPAFGDNGLKGMASLDATERGRWLLGDAISGQVVFDESPSLMIDERLPGADAFTVEATYAAPGVRACDPAGIRAVKKLGSKMDELVGGAAVVSGLCTVPGDDLPAARVVLIGPHFELTSDHAKHQVLARAVAWAAGREPAGTEIEVSETDG